MTKRAPPDFRLLARAVCDDLPSAADAALERDINRATARLINAPTTQARRAAYARLRALHRRRSPAQVGRMERAMGLRP